MAALASPDPQLTCDDLLRLQPSPQAYLDRFRPLFPRRDQAASLGVGAEGLLSGERRKSVERMVLHELDGDMNQVRRPWYFAADSPWAVPGRHRLAVGAELGRSRTAPAGGRGGAGQARGHPAGGHDRHAQAGGAFGGRGPAVLRSAGWVANCQAGVFVAYAGEGWATLGHRRLFLTEAWTGDAAYAGQR